MGTSSLGHGEIGPMTIEALESRRQRRQVEIDSSKDIESRRVMGQFATPHDLSYQIVSETLPFLSLGNAPPCACLRLRWESGRLFPRYL